MPIYEFYCENCNTIYNFLSRSINTDKTPTCPKCDDDKLLSRQISVFAITGRASENSEMENPPFDEAHMEKALGALAHEAGGISEDDPRQAANLMRKLTDMTGLKLGAGMNEALSRMEKGEDPEMIENEMADIMESEDPFIIPGKKEIKSGRRYTGPLRDETLYEL